jgi:molybdopterin-containing oxidoreductase family membrane subunit
MTNTVSQSGFNAEHGASATTWSKVLWIVWIALLAAGSIGVAQRLMHGHTPTGYGSYVPWGLWIGLYFLGVGISGGAFIIGALGYLLGVSGFSKPEELRTAIVLSLAAIIPAFIGVTLDLGHPERLFHVLLYPTFTSMMAFNAWMYNVFIVVVLLAWFLTYKEQTALLKPLLVLGTFLSTLFPSQSGVFFEAVRTNQFWHSPILSVLFLASAIALGAAGLILVQRTREVSARTAEAYEAADRLRIVAIAAIVVYLMFEFAEFSIVFWNPGAHSPNVVFLLVGDYWPVFWILHILLGSLAPLVLFFGASKAGWMLSSLLVLVGFAAARMCILIPGQVAGQIPGLELAFQDVRLTYTYHATSTEYLVGCFMVAAGMAIFFVGMRLSWALSSDVAQKA